MLIFDGKKVFLSCGATDMRKSINGLMNIVQNSFQLDPFDTSIFVFCNKNRDRIKILEWDYDGFWLYFKRLEKGRFRWPGLPARAGRNASDQGNPGDEPTMVLSPEELSVLLGGVKVELKLKRNEVFTREK